MHNWLEIPLTFMCGEAELLGVLHRAPSADARLGVMVVVGGPQYRVGSHRQFTLMARSLAASGFPVMRFDYRGMGDSDGEPAGFMRVRDDLRAALEAFFRAVPSLEKVVLWGLCDAASAVAMDRPMDARVAGLVLVNPWVRSESGEARAYLKHYYLQRLLQASFWRKVLTGGFNPVRGLADFFRKYRVAREDPGGGRSGPERCFVERMSDGLTSFRGPILVQISGRDLTAAEFMDLVSTNPVWGRIMARSNVTVTRFETADHTFSVRADLDRATGGCLAWLRAIMSEGGRTLGAGTHASVVAR